jgi:hypothetical protein
MRPRPYAKAVKDLGPLFAAKGITLEASTNGKGSHRSMILIDTKSAQRVSIVLAGGKDVSPVVQRGILAYLARRADEFDVGHPGRDHAERSRKIFERYFNN